MYYLKWDAPTSMSVQGKYKERIEDEEDEQTKDIKIKFGYSRDKRPDLKQFMLNMKYDM